MPDALQAQREELENVYRDLCQDVSEISGVIRQLGTMSGFQGSIAALRREQRNGSEQQIKLRQSASALGRAAELYRRTELENLDGGTVRIAFPGWRAVFRIDPSRFNVGKSPEDRYDIRVSPIREDFQDWTITGRPQEMLDGAEHWYQMEVVIPQRN